MPEQRLPSPSANWHDAFRALPDETPPADGWARLSAALDARARPRRRLLPWAIAASMLLAFAIPAALWQRDGHDAAPVQVTAGIDAAPAADGDPLARLQADSAWYESLLTRTRDERVVSGNALLIADDLDARIAEVDAALLQPDLTPARQIELWQLRVARLRDAAEFQANRRWLAAQGSRFDGTPMYVN